MMNLQRTVALQQQYEYLFALLSTYDSISHQIDSGQAPFRTDVLG